MRKSGDHEELLPEKLKERELMKIRHMWVDNSKIYLETITCDGIDWIRLA
jgi:hypothetical protein